MVDDRVRLGVETEAVAVWADCGGFPHNGIATLTNLVVRGVRGDLCGGFRTIG